MSRFTSGLLQPPVPPYLESKIPYIVEQVNKQLDTAKEEPKKDGKLYRVQVGAFAVKSNADAMLKKIKAAGFEDAFIAVAKE